MTGRPHNWHEKFWWPSLAKFSGQKGRLALAGAILALAGIVIPASLYAQHFSSERPRGDYRAGSGRDDGAGYEGRRWRARRQRGYGRDYPDSRSGRAGPAGPADDVYGDEGSAPRTGGYPRKSAYCRELEQRLASNWIRGNSSQNRLPELNQKIRQQDALFNKLQNRADRMNCYESMFIFGRSLRNTRRCHAIDRKIRAAKRKLAELRDQRDSIRDARRGGNRRDQLLRELARNDCGDQYRYEVRRRSSSGYGWLDDTPFGEFFGNSRPPRRHEENIPQTIQPYATYRTMCVRLCDGYYFPVSFSTLPSNFSNDAEICQNKCAAPARLFVYRNPGGEVAQMISPDGSEPYDSLKNAWRYRKEYVRGCSCKAAEYSEETIAAYEAEKKNRKAGKDKAPKGADKSGKKGASSTPPAPQNTGSINKSAKATKARTQLSASRKRAKSSRHIPSSIDDLLR